MPSSLSAESVSELIQEANSKLLQTIQNEFSQTQQLTRFLSKLTETNLSYSLILDKLNTFFDTKSEAVIRFKREFNAFIQIEPTEAFTNEQPLNETSPAQSKGHSHQLVDVKTEPDYNGHAFYNRAVYHSRRKDFKNALRYYEKSIVKDPHFAEAYCGKGEAYYYLNNNEEALKCFEKSIELNANNPDAYSGKGLVFADLKNYTEAIQFYNKAIELNPTNGELYANIADSLDKLEDRGDEVITSYLKAIEYEPSDADLYLQLGLSFKKYRKDFKQAFECFDKASQLMPSDAYYHYNKGDALDNLGQGDQAIECYNLAISLESNDQDFYCSLGVALKKYKKEYSKALDCFQKALNIVQEPNYYYYKGDTHLLLEDYSSAIECFDRAIDLDANNSDYYYSRGTAYQEMHTKECKEGSLERAIENYERSLELNPNDYDCLCDLGTAYHAKKRLGKAGSCYKKAILIEPYRAVAYNARGLMLNDKNGFKNDYKEAINCYTRAIELDPTNALFYRNKGITFFNMGKYESAIECYDEAIRLDSTESEFYFYKGKAFKLLRQYLKAMNCFKKAISLKSNYMEAKKNLAIVKQKLESEKLGLLGRSLEEQESK